MLDNIDFENIDLEKTARETVKILNALGRKVASAESCTAGMFSGTLTNVPGASGVFDMGITSYSDEAKQKLLGVTQEAIEQSGAVSSTVAAMMAAGIRRISEADVGVGITGIAGPSGGSPEKPVGTVFVALAIDGEIWVEKLMWTDEHENRDTIRTKTVTAALHMLKRYLSGDAAGEFTRYEYASFPAAKNEDEKTQVTKRNPFMSFLKFFIPWKGDRTLEVIRKFVLLAALVTFVCAAIPLTRYFLENHEADKIIENAVNAYRGEPSARQLSDLPEGYLEKFAGLYGINQDVKGWIYIPGTDVNYPVVQKEDDNEYYLKRSFNKTYSDFGVPFLDYRCTIMPQTFSTNTIMYSHNIKTGKFFAQLLNYNNVDFYKQHPVITFDTVYDEREWVVFGAFLATMDEKDGPVFNYHHFVDKESDGHFNWYADQVKLRSIIQTDVDVTPDDYLLTLSTCSYELGQNTDTRFVVVARMLRPGEKVDASGARINPTPLYPDLWYAKNNKQKPPQLRNISPEFDPVEYSSTESAPALDDSEVSAVSSEGYSVPPYSYYSRVTQPRPSSAASVRSTSSAAQSGSSSSAQSSAKSSSVRSSKSQKSSARASSQSEQSKPETSEVSEIPTDTPSESSPGESEQTE
ncbi:MAG: nicotinamide-nucleotide amidohydrolase family protein [Oscillospiraceae bacterium]|nr:nicotinamide-nucleotide amidohydrolase family protein [Oscillospiraceae bacterium]